MQTQLIEQDKETGFTFERVYKGSTDHHRILSDRKGYEQAKRYAKSDASFSALVDWYEGKENKLSSHEREVQKKFLTLQGRKRPDGGTYLHQDIADIAGCSKGTVGNVLNGRNQLSEELADHILKTLDENGVI